MTARDKLIEVIQNKFQRQRGIVGASGGPEVMFDELAEAILAIVPELVERCPACDGDGLNADECKTWRCYNCHGTGIRLKQKEGRMENPQAFPFNWYDQNSIGETVVRESQPGMNLRDYFAGQALVGLRSQSLKHPSNYPMDAKSWTPDDYAKMAYKLADAMLKARKEAPVSEVCPTCGARVRVVGDVTKHYEPVALRITPELARKIKRMSETLINADGEYVFSDDIEEDIYLLIKEVCGE